MDLTLLATLKDKLRHAKNFTDVFGYFLDHFGEDPAFIALGDRAEDPFLEAVIDQVGQQLFGKPVELTDLLLKRVPGHPFLHGGGLIDGRLLNVLYFEDIHMGLLAVVLPSETKMVRFSGRPLSGNREPSRN